MSNTALLALEDGSIFWGASVGATGVGVGDLTFTTSLTGYQEMITDPASKNAMVVTTYPHLGNVGINPEDFESDKAQIQALIMREKPDFMSNFRSTGSLTDYLVEQGVLAIAGLDTRKITRLLREKGSLKAVLLAGDNPTEEAAQAKLQEFAGFDQIDLVKEVSPAEQKEWTEGTWSLGKGYASAPETNKNLVVLDLGAKRTLLRQLVSQGAKVTQVGGSATAKEILSLNPDGLVVSSGPGNPNLYSSIVATLKDLAEAGLPIMGIGLGYQLLAMAFGAQAKKMKLGNFGANHSIQKLANKRVFIVRQNHAYELDEATIPADLEITFKSLFDGSVQGFAHKSLAVFGMQGHLEGAPGPEDLLMVFDEFNEKVTAYQASKA